MPGKIVKRLGIEAWQVLLVAACTLIAGGVAFATWNQGKATVEQLDSAKASFTAQLGAAQGTTAAQLGALQGQQQDQAKRLASVEGRLDLLILLQQQVLDQGRAIARATGARVVPSAAPPEPSHPPSTGGQP